MWTVRDNGTCCYTEVGNVRVHPRFQPTSEGWNLGWTREFPNPATLHHDISSSKTAAQIIESQPDSNTAKLDKLHASHWHVSTIKTPFSMKLQREELNDDCSFGLILSDSHLLQYQSGSRKCSCGRLQSLPVIANQQRHSPNMWGTWGISDIRQNWSLKMSHTGWFYLGHFV